MNKTIKLKTPIQVNGETIEQMVIRPPKVRDRLVAEKTPGGTAEKEVTFISNLCSVSQETIMELDLADYVQLQEAVNHFLS
jgi:Phage tail assembly chaperone proteins, E, or 41 or 14